MLILATFGQEDHASQAMDAGARGFLLKRMPADGLIAFIKNVATASVEAIG